ncbi:MAG: A/G-specific adenine glycosylase [Mariprofundaceae bacterium]|nr:A/G-specific adenine glycosylase [Mariprofundaceae bacterium]
MSSARCKALHAWYNGAARALPWRETTDPYRIWISEIMLQQTQVKTVLPRYQTWFERFPDIENLAAAHLDDVLKAWEGLGYYRRARFIHQTAQRIVTTHNGIFPHAFEAIVALPGIGRSTAGAIASFCFAAASPVLDGNVKRVLKRWHGMPQATEKTLWQQAQKNIDDFHDPATCNQAMMELGATLCTVKKTDCACCPVAAHCVAAFQVESIQKNSKSTHIRDVHWQVHLHLNAQKGIWLTQRPDSGIWAGLWTPPISELNKKPAHKPCHIHLLTHRRLHLYSDISHNPPTGNGQWVVDIAQLALPTGIHHLLTKKGATASIKQQEP